MEQQQSGANLSENGILYLSSGFEGPYILQVIAFAPLGPNNYNLCLTDGRLYIGGKYVSQTKLNILVYSVVRIEAKFISKWCPIQISKLEVINDKVNYLIGKAPATLHDYFLEQKDNNFGQIQQTLEKSSNEGQNKSKGEIDGAPRKRSKVEKQKEEKQLVCSSSQPLSLVETQTQKLPVNSPNPVLLNHLNAETQSIKFKSDSQNNSCSQLQQISPCLSSFNNYPKHDFTQTTSKPNPMNRFNKNKVYHRPNKTTQPEIHQVKKCSQLYIADQYEIFLTKQLTKSGETHNVYISDLYERMMRWKILCRIVNVRSFISAKGKKCKIMQVIDQKGDQIKAVYYFSKNKDKLRDQQAQNMTEGRVYSIQGGQIKKNTGSQTEQLQITLDFNCTLEQYKDIFMFPYSSKHITKFQKIKQTQKPMNVIGILKSYQIIQPNQTNYKSKPKIKGLLYNPLQKMEIEFSKILLQGQVQPIKDSIYVLNNFVNFQADNSVRLIGVNNSFLVRVSEEDLEYNKAPSYPQHKQLSKLRQQLQKHKSSTLPSILPTTPIHNLSQTIYTKRSISQLLQMSSQTQNSLYSQMLISIGDIKLKKQYMACPICKRSTIQQQESYIMYQCLKCKKIVDPVPTIIIRLLLADATGSIEIDVFGGKVEVFIGVAVQEFIGLGEEEKECTLQIAKFSQFVVKIKTQRKSFKQLNHTLQEVQKQQLVLTMKQIRRRTVQQKLKFQDKWQTQI